MGRQVEESIRGLVGTTEGGETVRMGADLTPTKKIDQVAEDCVLGYLNEHPLWIAALEKMVARFEAKGA